MHKQPSSLRQLIVYRLPETTYHRASTNTQHTSLTTLERRYDPFVIHDSNHRQHDMTGLQSSRLPTPTAHCLDPGARLRSRFQAIDDSRQSSSSKQSTRAQSLRLPSNRREHKVFAFHAIDESTKSSSSKQSTTAQSLRLPSNRPAFLHQHTERRAATRQRQLAASTADHARTNHTHWLSQCTLVRSHCTHARATHSPYKHKLQENCMPVSRTNSLSLLNGNKNKKKKKRKEIEKRTTHSPYKHKLHKTRKTYECQVCAPEKMPFLLARPMSQFTTKKKKKGSEVHCCLCSTQSRTNKLGKKK